MASLEPAGSDLALEHFALLKNKQRKVRLTFRRVIRYLEPGGIVSWLDFDIAIIENRFVDLGTDSMEGHSSVVGFSVILTLQYASQKHDEKSDRENRENVDPPQYRAPGCLP